MTTLHQSNTTLRLDPTLRVVEAPGLGVFLLGEDKYHVLRSALHRRLLPLLMAGTDHQSLATALAGEFHPLAVFLAVEELAKQGLLAAAFTPAGPRAVALRVLGERSPEPLATVLRTLGLAVRDEADLHVLLVDSYLNPGLGDEATRCRAAGITLLPLYAGHRQSWLGPLLDPAGSPCWQCLAERLWDNHPVEAFLRRQGLQSPPPAPPDATAQALAAGLLTLGLARLGSRADSAPTLLRLIHGDGSLHHHRVLAGPACPVCGDPGLARRPTRVVLQSRPLGFAADGGYRLTDPAASCMRLADRVDPLTGIVGKLGPLPGRDHPDRPVWAATHPLHPQGAPGPEDFQQISLGKGQTPAQARMSALGEALERWSARHRLGLPVRRASLAELGEGAVHPARLMILSDSQYARREAINAGLSDPRRHVPLRCPPGAVLDWTPLWSLTHERPRWLPASFCYSQYPTPPEEDYARFSSNGNAAGHCLEEAILQGFLELVERDAVAIWWYNRLPRPALDLASVEAPYPRRLAARYGELGWRLWCLDLTTDLGLPVVVALAGGETRGDCFVGFGCHLEPQLALLRALTELNQLFDPDNPASRPWAPDALPDWDFLYPQADAEPRPLGTLPGARFDDLREAVRHCLTLAASLDLETLVLDQTRPEAGLHAVKVVVPGLRHFWPRLGPGRLYQVPVDLGWRQGPLAEAALNPLGLYL